MGFTKAKSITFPREVLIGHGVLSRLPELCAKLELGTNLVVVTGNATRKLAGNAAKDFLEAAGYNLWLEVFGDATKENVEKVVECAREVNADFVLGVGGGSKIDIAKVAASTLSKPMISVPTAASHDGIASPQASIKCGGKATSIDATVPLGILADTALILKAPYRMLAAGCADVIANLTAVKDWTLAHRLKNEPFSTSAAALSTMSANEIIENASLIRKGVEESVWLAIKPLIESGASMCVAGSSRPTSGAEHMFSHTLDALTHGKAFHGEQCGVGAVMMMYLHDGDWQEVRDALLALGAPTTARELGVSKELVIRALAAAHKVRPERYTILGESGISEAAAEKLVEHTEVA
jgi:glycerol-1-phosphate dehydrogenase [NAD(P)+]